MGFIGLKNFGEAFALELFDELEKMGFNYSINGSEHTHPDFVKNLHASIDQTSLSIRFQPDSVVSRGDIPQTAYIEAKRSKSIEKLAYTQYMKLSEAGNIVIVVFEKFNWKWNRVEEIGFIPSEEVVGKYSNPWPIDNEGWISPRQSTSWSWGFIDKAGMSGTPHKMVDPQTLRPWRDFSGKVFKQGDW